MKGEINKESAIFPFVFTSHRLVSSLQHVQKPFAPALESPSLTSVSLFQPFLVNDTIYLWLHNRPSSLYCLAAVSITDKADVIFGGSDAPTALGCLYSIGAIGMESNGQITAAVTDLLAPFGVDEARIYINFFDMPRANVGWSRRTFAG